MEAILNIKGSRKGDLHQQRMDCFGEKLLLASL